jgi:microcystin-dependent protein
MDLALGGLVTISVTGLLVDQTMVLSQYQPMTIVFSGTLSANLKYSLPATVGGKWAVYNNTTGAFTLSMGSPTGPTTVVIPAGGPYDVTCNSSTGIAFVNGYNAANSIATAMIQNDAVTTAKILDANVTYAKLAAAVQALFVPTGSIMPYAGSTSPSGWLLCSGLTIGNAASGGTARANADTQVLFEQLWDSFSNTELPIFTSAGAVSTRGVSASADFAANKRLTIPDLRGRTVAGKDNMGGTAANRLANTRTIAVSTIAQATTVVTVVTSTAHGLDAGNSITIAGAGNAVFNGTWTVATVVSSTSFTFTRGTSATITAVAGGTITVSVANAVDGATLGASGGLSTHTLTVGQMPSHNHTFTAALQSGNVESGSGDPEAGNESLTTNNTGGSGPHNNVQPTFVLNYVIKL